MKRLLLLICLLLSTTVLFGCESKNIEWTTQEETGSASPENTAETQIKQHELYEKKYPLPLDVQAQDIYRFNASGHGYPEFDLTYPSIATHSDLIAKCKVLSMEKTYMGENWPLPHTSYMLEIEEVFKGKLSSTTIKISTQGGFIRIEDYIKMSDQSTQENDGYTKLSKEEQQTKYLGIFSKSYETILPGKSYVFFLKKASQDAVHDHEDYYEIGDGAGVYRYNEKTQKYQNAHNKTGITLDELQKLE